MKSSSVLTFTCELSVNGKIPFLDVDIKSQHGQFVTDVYRKTTNDCKLLNAKSECPDRYKSCVFDIGIRRAHKICICQDLLNIEHRDENKYWLIAAVLTLTLIITLTSFYIKPTHNKLLKITIKSRFIIKI